MLNIERYKDKILRQIKEGRNLKCVLHDLRTEKNECDYCTCNNCSIDSINWLADEYKPKIKLSKFEYDLVESCISSSSYLPKDLFYVWDVLMNLQKKGYFKNIDSKMSLHDIFVNAEVKENE